MNEEGLYQREPIIKFFLPHWVNQRYFGTDVLNLSMKTNKESVYSLKIAPKELCKW